VAWRFFGAFTRGAVLTAACVGGLGYLVLLGLGVPLALPLAVLVFVGSFVPLIGAPAAMTVAMLVALASDGVWKAVLVGVGIALVGQLEGHLIQPLVMGRHARLHPFVIGVGVSAGTIVGGLFGAIVAIPVIGVTWAVFSALRTPPEPDDVPGAGGDLAVALAGPSGEGPDDRDEE
jgi:predicted PurR-regulated permease PerM